MAVLIDYAALPAAELEALAGAVERLATLEEVVRWGLRLPGSPVIAEVVVQDEFCHDVILPWRGELHLAFDTT